MKLFSCPYQPNCASSDASTILPSLDGEMRKIHRTEGSSGLCRYLVQFPMDALNGDSILIRAHKLEGVTLSVGIGSEFKSSEFKNSVYEFDSAVNEDGGFVKFAYPNEAYLVIYYS
jgi:hypothetical protein